MAELPAWTSDAALASLVDTLDEGVLVFDEGLRCRLVGRRVEAMFRVDGAGLVGALREDVIERISASNDAPLALWEGVGEIPAASRAVELASPSGRSFVWTSSPIAAVGGAVGLVDVVRDVSGERVAEQSTVEMARKLEAISVLDALTGLPNRKHFEAEADKEHRRAQRAWEPYAIARIDVDEMSALNAALGRDVGDDLLRRLGEELRAARREYDIVARWDGDQLIVLLPGASPKAAKTVVKRSVRAVRDKVFDVVGGIRISVSAGAAVWSPPSGETAEDIVRRAGLALDVAKARGPGSLEIDGGPGTWKDEPTDA